MSRWDRNAGQFRDAKTGRFISVKTELRLQMREKRLRKAIAKANESNLWSVGYLISQIAKAKIKRSRKASKAGQPPHTRRGQLRRAIRYAVDRSNLWNQYVVIGPRFSMAGTSGEAHEKGGKYKGEHFEKRPFMGPALEEALPQIGPQWQGTVN